MDKGIKLQAYKQRHGHDINGVRPVMIPDESGDWVSRFDAEHLAEQLQRAQRANTAQDDHINQQAERIESLEKKNAALGRELSRYSLTPGQADQRMCESRAVREALGFGKDDDNVAPIDLRKRIDDMKVHIAELKEKMVQAQQEYQAIEQKLISAAVYIETLESEPRKTNLKLLNEIAGLKRKCAELEDRTLSFKLPDPSSKAFWGGSGKNETFYPSTYKVWVADAIERAGVIAGIKVEVK